MAGKAKVCSHAAAIMFKIQHAVQMQLTGQSKTDLLMSWNRGTRRQLVPQHMAEITFGSRETVHAPAPEENPPAESHDELKERLLKKSRWRTLLLEPGSVLSDTAS